MKCKLCSKENDVLIKINEFLFCENCGNFYQNNRSKFAVKNSKYYWLLRGFSEEDAKERVSIIQKERSPRSVLYWIKRGFSEEDAKEQVTIFQTKNGKKNPACIDYWLQKGFSEEDAKEQSNQIGRNNSVRCKEYWLQKGFSEEDAKEQVHFIGDTSSQESFIRRLGEKQGLIAYYNKIKKLKHARSIEGYIERYGHEKGLVLYEKHKQDNQTIGKTSKKANAFFDKLMNYIPNVKHNIYYGKKEFGKQGKKQYYFYDFVIPELKICIEFNGDVFHANPRLFSCDDTPNFFKPKMTSEEIWNHDEEKNNTIKKAGFDVYIVWETDNLDSKINKFKILKNEKNERI